MTQWSGNRSSTWDFLLHHVRFSFSPRTKWKVPEDLGFLFPLDPGHLWICGSSGSVVPLDLWFLWILFPLDPGRLWICGSSGSGAPLDLWFFWICGSSGSVVPLVLWFLWIQGASGSVFLWFLWFCGSCCDSLGFFFLWVLPCRVFTWHQSWFFSSQSGSIEWQLASGTLWGSSAPFRL